MRDVFNFGERVEAALACIQNHGYEIGESDDWCYVKSNVGESALDLLESINIKISHTGVQFRTRASIELDSYTALRGSFV